MKILILLAADPVVIAIGSFVGFLITLFIGLYIVRWYHRTDEQIGLLEKIVELQKEQLKYFKDKIVEPDKSNNPEFKQWIEEEYKKHNIQ